MIVLFSFWYRIFKLRGTENKKKWLRFAFQKTFNHKNQLKIKLETDIFYSDPFSLSLLCRSYVCTHTNARTVEHPHQSNSPGLKAVRACLTHELFSHRIKHLNWKAYILTNFISKRTTQVANMFLTIICLIE